MTVGTPVGRRPLLGGLAMVTGGMAGTAVAAPGLRGICNVAERRRLIGKPGGAVTCAPPPPPVRDLQPETFYTDRASSVVDEAKFKRYQAETKELSDFLVKTVQFGAAWLRSSPATPQGAQCALGWMDTWASGGALTGDVSAPNGEHQRKWILSGLALAYLKIREEPSLDRDAKRRVEAWLAGQAEASLAFYGTYRRGSYNNHIWWMALAVAATAVATGRAPMFDRALGYYRDALEDIAEDGTIPAEMARKGRALIYHITSLTPLVMLAEFGEANGIPLYGERNGALHRLARRVQDGMQDTAWFAARTGTAQDWGDTPGRAWTIGWAEPYYARFPNPELGALIQRNRPVFYPYLGGSPTDDFGSPRLGAA